MPPFPVGASFRFASLEFPNVVTARFVGRAWHAFTVIIFSAIPLAGNGSGVGLPEDKASSQTPLKTPFSFLVTRVVLSLTPFRTTFAGCCSAVWVRPSLGSFLPPHNITTIVNKCPTYQNKPCPVNPSYRHVITHRLSRWFFNYSLDSHSSFVLSRSLSCFPFCCLELLFFRNWFIPGTIIDSLCTIFYFSGNISRVFPCLHEKKHLPRSGRLCFPLSDWVFDKVRLHYIVALSLTPRCLPRWH